MGDQKITGGRPKNYRWRNFGVDEVGKWWGEGAELIRRSHALRKKQWHGSGMAVAVEVTAMVVVAVAKVARKRPRWWI